MSPGCKATPDLLVRQDAVRLWRPHRCRRSRQLQLLPATTVVVESVASLTATTVATAPSAALRPRTRATIRRFNRSPSMDTDRSGSRTDLTTPPSLAEFSR